MPLNRTKSGWLTVTETANEEVRKTAQHISGLEAACTEKRPKHRKHTMVSLKKRTRERTLAPPALKHKNPTEVGRPAPRFHKKLVRRRDTTIKHPVDPHTIGEIGVIVHKQFPRFQQHHVGDSDDLFDRAEERHRTPNAPTLHNPDRGLQYGSPRTGSRSYRSLTERPALPAKLPDDQAALVVVRKPQPPPLTRAASLALAVRGWHAVERGTLPGGPSVARRKFEHLPAWEKTSQAQFSREEAKIMLEDGLAGRPSPLGLVSSARPSSTGGQQRLKHPLHVGEHAPIELDRNMPRAATQHTSTVKLVPSNLNMHMLAELAQDDPSATSHHRLNDKGTGLRSQHKLKRGLNSSPWSLTMSCIADTHRQWVAAAVVIQERHRIRRSQRKAQVQNDAATILQRRARGFLCRRALAARQRAAMHIQRVQRGRRVRARTAKDRRAKRLARIAKKRQEEIDQLIFTANGVRKVKDSFSARKAARDMKMLEQERQRQAERLERLSQEEKLQQEQKWLAAEAARQALEKLQKAMICFGNDDPFSSDPDEVARFAKDVRTGRVIRCADGVTRVVYSLEEARSVIATSSFR